MRANDPEWRDQITTFSLRTNLHQCCKLLITCQLLMMESDPTEISKANLFLIIQTNRFLCEVFRLEHIVFNHTHPPYWTFSASPPHRTLSTSQFPTHERTHVIRDMMISSSFYSVPMPWQVSFFMAECPFVNVPDCIHPCLEQSGWLCVYKIVTIALRNRACTSSLV